MFDRLVCGDRATKGVAALGIFDGSLEQFTCRTVDLSALQNHRKREHPVDRLARAIDGAVVGSIDGAGEAVDRMLALAVILQCAQINGAAGELFERTIEYAKCRYAFGRPIAAYQAIKHRIADLLQ